mmetsp:Transcript_600/g.2021  ORF Transcript_600/g.2021 Transcript_600/m.2021 type:complete len:200 (+) Transcript_600:301-900(+)
MRWASPPRRAHRQQPQTRQGWRRCSPPRLLLQRCTLCRRRQSRRHPTLARVSVGKQGWRRARMTPIWWHLPGSGYWSKSGQRQRRPCRRSRSSMKRSCRVRPTSGSQRFKRRSRRHAKLSIRLQCRAARRTAQSSWPQGVSSSPTMRTRSCLRHVRAWMILRACLPSQPRRSRLSRPSCSPSRLTTRPYRTSAKSCARL